MKKLKELREKHYTYENMANKLCISKSYYWQLENEKRRLYYDLVIRIAKIFNLKPDTVFFNYFANKLSK